MPHSLEAALQPFSLSRKRKKTGKQIPKKYKKTQKSPKISKQ
jgi:hypothetical protein